MELVTTSPQPPDNTAPTPALDQLLLAVGQLPSTDRRTTINNYITHVANDGLPPTKTIVHYSLTSDGGKAGLTLYQHILNGILLLDLLSDLADLTALERQVLFTAYTLHDINKTMEHHPDTDSNRSRRYVDVSRLADIEQAISNWKLDVFFPGYAAYLNDIQFIMRLHGKHTPAGIDHLRAPTVMHNPTTLARPRIMQLVALVHAADHSDLAHTIADHTHHRSILNDINRATPRQYALFYHHLGEQRGSLTNLLHNAVRDELQDRFGAIPLLLYPDGIVYLLPADNTPVITDAVLPAIARRATVAINKITGAQFAKFIKAGNMGINVGAECLNLGIPFDDILAAITAILARRTYKPERLAELRDDSARRTQEQMDKSPPPADVRSAVEALIARGAVPTTTPAMATAELLRTYFIFLSDHFPHLDAWQHLYDLLQLTPTEQAVYAQFNARMDRASAITVGNNLTSTALEARIAADGTALLATRPSNDPREPLLTAYLRLLLTFPAQPQPPATYATALPSYVAAGAKHKQCSQCSLPFETTPLMSNEVRDGIKVQFFSNRLRGGGGEPKRNVCRICQTQNLLDKLNYPDRGGDGTFYLHCFPYAAMPALLLEAMQRTFRDLVTLNLAEGAMRLNAMEETLHHLATKHPFTPTFTTNTRTAKTNPYGVYLPRFSDTVGATMTLLINAPDPDDSNDTTQVLFALQHALVLQRHLGCKVLLTRSAVPPLASTSIGDLYLDNVPLSVQGLVRHNNLTAYVPQSNRDGTLHTLYHRLDALLHIRNRLGNPQKGDSELQLLVRALNEHPFTLLHVAERMAQRQHGKDASHRLQQVTRPLFALVTSILEETKDSTMQLLSEHIQALAHMAWQQRLRGRSLVRSSLLLPMTEAFDKLAMLSPGSPLDPALLQAAAANDLADHIARIEKGTRYQRGRPKLQHASSDFMAHFFAHIFQGAYGGKVPRLLADRKVLLSAYYLYIQQELATTIARKDELADDLDLTPDA